MGMDFRGKVALVTGSSRGLGREIVLELAKHHCNVVINYVRHEEEAFRLKEEIKTKYFVQAEVVKMDVSKEEDVKYAMELIQDRFGRLDILVNNAAITNDTLPLSKTKEGFMRVLEVNLYGTYLVSSLAFPFLKESTGTIVNISSTNGIDTLYPESLDYDASKAGVISLTHNFAKALVPVRVNCVCPGWMNTEMNETLEASFKEEECNKILLGRFAESNEVAKVVVYLASTEAGYMNDSIVRIDGGMK